MRLSPTRLLSRALVPFLFLAAAPAIAQTEFSFPVAGGDPGCRQGISGVQPNGDGILEPESQKCGTGAVALDDGALAVGADALALAVNATAIGRDTRASGTGSTVLGAGSTATADRATAIGSGAHATHSGSTVLGAGATSSANNQVTLGAAGTSVRLGDIAASTAAQSGPLWLVTVDASGTLGRLTGVATLQELAALQNQQAALSGRLDALAGVQEIDRRDSRQGIAAAMAIGQAPMPSAPGRTSYVFNLATFRGEQAIGGSVMHRIDTSLPFAVSAGFAYSGNGNNGGRIGVAGEF